MFRYHITTFHHTNNTHPYTQHILPQNKQTQPPQSANHYQRKLPDIVQLFLDQCGYFRRRARSTRNGHVTTPNRRFHPRGPRQPPRFSAPTNRAVRTPSTATIKTHTCHTNFRPYPPARHHTTPFSTIHTPHTPTFASGFRNYPANHPHTHPNTPRLPYKKFPKSVPEVVLPVVFSDSSRDRSRALASDFFCV